MSRSDWVDRFCARLSAAIAREAPAGIGAWPEAWSRVQLAHDALMVELRSIEAGAGDTEAAKRMGVDLLNAWRHVGARYCARGVQGG